MKQLVYQIVLLDIKFHFTCCKLDLKHCKVPKYYDHDFSSKNCVIQARPVHSMNVQVIWLKFNLKWRSALFEIHTRPEDLIKIICVKMLTSQANCGAQISIVAKQLTSTNDEHDMDSLFCRFIASFWGLFK